MEGIEPNLPIINRNLDNSLMLVTALSPIIGYDNASHIARSAFINGTTLREEALKSGLITPEQFDEAIEKEKHL